MPYLHVTFPQLNLGALSGLTSVFSVVPQMSTLIGWSKQTRNFRNRGDWLLYADSNSEKRADWLLM